MGKSTTPHGNYTYVIGSLNVDEVPSIVIAPPHSLPSMEKLEGMVIVPPPKIVQNVPNITHVPVNSILPAEIMKILEGTAPFINIKVQLLNTIFELDSPL